jgi:hypothetical protein
LCSVLRPCTDCLTFCSVAPNKGAPQTWYFPGEAGYIDYPTLAEEAAKAPA